MVSTNHHWIPVKKDKGCRALMFHLWLPLTCCWTNCLVSVDYRFQDAVIMIPYDVTEVEYSHIAKTLGSTYIQCESFGSLSNRCWSDGLCNQGCCFMTWCQWKCFPCYWPFVRGIHQSPLVDSPNNGPVALNFYVSLNKLLNKHLIGLWFGLPWCSCNIIVM